MKEKSTKELENELKKTHITDLSNFLYENDDVMISDDRPFKSYMKKIIDEKNIKRQTIFLRADIPERYGYKLLSEEKRTKQRDVILRICYAAEFSLEEAQKALRIYQMPKLYIVYPRDSVLMKCFDERPGGIIEVNEILRLKGFDTLRTSGLQE